MSERSAVVAGVGASRGLGAAIARRFAREGFRITVLGRSAEKLGATLKELREGGAVAEAVIGDVTDEALVRRAVAQADAPECAARGRHLQRRRKLAEGVPRDGHGLPRRHVARERAGGLLLREGRSGSHAAAPARRPDLHRRVGVAARPRRSSAASRRPRRRCARSRSRPRASSVPRASTWRTWWSTAPSTAIGSTPSCRGSRRQRGPDGLLDPDAIAENFWQLYLQPRSAWTHEIDVRPWVEPW